jgi:hypothetical protein
VTDDCLRYELSLLSSKKQAARNGEISNPGAGHELQTYRHHTAQAETRKEEQLIAFTFEGLLQSHSISRLSRIAKETRL